MGIAAQLDIVSKTSKRKGRRGAARRELKLRARGASVSGEATHVLVRNISATGLLVETAADLQVGDRLEIDLPETGRNSAKVIWADKDLFGCVFDRPLPRAALSAVQLRSEPEIASAKAGDEHTAPVAGAANREEWGRHLKELRMARGLSLVRFAQLMDVSRPTVWAWEAGKSFPRAAKEQRIHQILGVQGLAPEPLAHTSMAEQPSRLPVSRTDQLRSVADEAKERVAAAAGVSPDKVKLIIEV